ncbi:MAG: alpha/beta fold hydrolase [Candidatus Obscuribacterales bacterium]|nr:alpha/beta fold hydrolase [Candidatus Obscuribacterales bacterium]
MSKRHRFAHNFILTLLLLLCATAGYGAPPEIDAVQKVDASAENSSKKKQKSKKQRKQRKKVVRGNAPCLAWLPQNTEARAAILCVHGLGLHNGTWEPFGKTMSQRGYAVYAIDVRGFGSWMEARGRERVDFASCLEDVRRTLKVIKRAHKALPVFILGESMGGAIALRTTAMYPDLVDGLISSVPAGDRFNQTKTSIKVAFHLINDPDKPFNVGEGVIKQATKDPELREAWLNDPLAKLELTPRELLQFDRFMKGNRRSARKIKDKPVLMVQGSNDKLVRPRGTMELFDRLATPEKKFVLITDAEHLIFEESQFSKADIDLVDKWISSQIGADRADNADNANNKD